MLRISYFLHNLPIDGDKIVNPEHQPRSTLQRHFSASGTHFCYSLSNSQGLLRPEVLGTLEKIINLIGFRTRDLIVILIYDHHKPIDSIKMLDS
jgi:hypothetical protein